MPVKISKLFKDSKFKDLSEQAKLLYIYSATNPDLNTVGVFSPIIDVVCIENGISLEELRKIVVELQNKSYLYVRSFGGTIYFIVPEHFNTIPKSEASITKVNKDLSSLPQDLVEFLESIGIKSSAKVRPFTKPNPEEITKYALSLGHLVDGKEFFDCYEEYSNKYNKKGTWVDSRGTQVRDWKAKLRKIWCKEENKIKEVSGAPEGFETFHLIRDGKVITPDSWRKGLPFSKSIALDIELKKEFNKIK
jgi:hypothetical protein